MTERKAEFRFAVAAFLGSLIFFTVLFAWSYRRNERLFYDKIAAVVSQLPESRQEIMKALKDTDSCDLHAGKEMLRRYGYEGQLSGRGLYLVFLTGGLLFAGSCTAVFLFFEGRKKKRLKARIRVLTEYLRAVEEGNYSLLPDKKQDFFSTLEDEIYKTVLALRESRELLRREKENLAKNLADISHQFKTPLTSLSVLSELLLSRLPDQEAEVVRKMEKQTEKLIYLSKALLILSRADAGVLPFEIRKVSVSDLIECSLESVLPLLEEKGQRVSVSGDTEQIFLSCDLGWTGEAVGNLLKNASEHAPENSRIRMQVWENPVCTEIALEDEGEGFSEKDLRHLFDRFYRGENSGRDHAGIGLALAKTLIESQNGEIRAQNRKEGGARFLIKFYKNV